MNRVLLISLLTALLGGFSSCNKCRNLDCKNEASCERREGICNCTYLYEGELCAEEVRVNHVGEYAGTITFPNPTNPFLNETAPITIRVIVEGSDASLLGVRFNFLGSDYAFTGKLTEPNVFVAVAKKLSVDGFGDITVLETSSGTFSGNQLNASINVRLEDIPQFPVNMTFIGSK